MGHVLTRLDNSPTHRLIHSESITSIYIKCLKTKQTQAFPKILNISSNYFHVIDVHIQRLPTFSVTFTYLCIDNHKKANKMSAGARRSNNKRLEKQYKKVCGL